MGDYDVVKEAFGVVGASGSGAAGEVGTISFVQVAMQPGKPQGLGRLGPRGVPLFALPGNPVSAYVSFEVFVRPALLAMMGVTDVALAVERGRVCAPMRSPRGRRQIARAVASRSDDGLVADPVWGQASHFVADLSRANAFVLIPEDVTSVAAGDEVDIVLLSGAPRVVDPKSAAAAPPESSTSGQGGFRHADLGLTHVRSDGTAHMVDISAKAVTAREASAAGRVLLSTVAGGGAQGNPTRVET